MVMLLQTTYRTFTFTSTDESYANRTATIPTPGGKKLLLQLLLFQNITLEMQDINKLT